MFRRTAYIMAAAAGVMSLAIALSLYMAALRWHSKEAREVEIRSGMSVREIAAALARDGVIGAPRLFELIARVKGTAGRLKSGTYGFTKGTTLVGALGKLERGDVIQYPLTIIEGWTARDIAAALAGQPHLASPKVPDEFLRLVAAREFIAKMGYEGSPSLEGYLYPDTYYVTKPLTAEALIKRLVGRFQEVWKTLDAEGMSYTGLSESQVVTLASIVEREAQASEERPMVARVFLNRLKGGMPLQSDPTIIYGLEDFDGNIRRADITNPHPYNTYVHAGLPPGPISNPGRASLKAVLHPAEAHYLYFVSKNDGTHHFSTTLAEHLDAVRKYQIDDRMVKE